MALAAAFALFGAVGYGYLLVLGTAVAPCLLPRRWLPHWPVALPFLGWGTLVAVEYPLNAAFPGRWVIVALGVTAVGLVVWSVRTRRLVWLTPRPMALVPLLAGGVTYVLGASLHVQAGTLSALVSDSDVEHFADVVAALLRYPIGWSPEAQVGLEATPIGLAYHSIHASISALTGADTFSTAVASHLVMLSLAPGAVYLFAREAAGLNARGAGLASVLAAASGLGLGVAGFGWGQQTAALATTPVALAAVARALGSSGRRSLLCGGVLGMLGAGSLYLVSAPLVGGSAAAFGALTLAGTRRGAPIAGRLAGVCAVAIAAGLLSHLSAAAFLFARLDDGLLRTDDMTGRSTHVMSFASLPAALGTAPLDFYRDATDVLGGPLVQWLPPAGEAGSLLAALAGLTLAVAAFGAPRVRRSRAILGTIASAATLALYLRILRPFPYGEFKLLSTAWFLIPVLVAAGATWLAGRRSAVSLALGTCSLLVFTAGVAATHLHVRTLLAGPWSAVLPEKEMQAARGAVAALPRGAAVWISNQLVPDAAASWGGESTLHRGGFPSREARATYLALRWRGVVTSLLAFSGRAAFGTVQRQSSELRAPLDPHRAEFVILDSAEDPLFLGLHRADLIYAAGRLRVYRQAGRATFSWDEVTITGEGALEVIGPANFGDAAPPPSAPLPIADTLPGRRQGFSIPVRSRTARPHPQSESPAHLALALFSPRERQVELSVATNDHGRRAQRLLLFPGVTWAALPDTGAGTIVRITGGPEHGESLSDLRVLAMVRLTGGEEAEPVWRSPAGVMAPFIAARRLSDNGQIEIASVNLSRDLASRAARLLGGETVWWRRPDRVTPDFMLDPHARLHAVGADVDRFAWVWLTVGAPALPTLHELPVAYRGLTKGTLPPVLTGPLLGREAPIPTVADGVIVKGLSPHLHLVEGGNLRWVTSLDVLSRRGISAPVVTLQDIDLWRLPVGLPLE